MSKEKSNRMGLGEPQTLLVQGEQADKLAEIAEILAREVEI